MGRRLDRGGDENWIEEGVRTGWMRGRKQDRGGVAKLGGAEVRMGELERDEGEEWTDWRSGWDNCS